ncbi:DNA mismatch repair protein MutS [Alkalihalobacillus alcalophilus ATCC 27647 = CGMCC 1.3604]|uniref:DNA mismatch repair protein MutS n=1 Tax=Alkalihalobacillus alcalophilus ATCC 27647 = CGMCC 1.3604 TaxID=1218173 RepID=A0A094WR35_ALKAL|nr:DNA mismatch repair protein MutS [Alkalihalobacillus alcalophilus]KGA98518.1 DNA mismatch repair protein MutS [Alkalihalobacillus alcalophilus ATCC 27647 = CGMCC 1.3604]MED1562668.1 DNA mismatch repair protein MutS [Alkalihalobacillus alcalophilus]THG90749.1 DNA mismatch repair protein MutS [Alkalihalobacillus alcalophilus ATCC 27647 = CGMCC 1.3604]
MAEQTPMMKQYLEIKAQHADAFLFFRLGDFYELFHEDAIKAAQELEITLTGRGKGDERIPMCGVPHHSAEQYMVRLIEKGYKIAICEQVEDPAVAKGVVKREVVRILTPGTVVDKRMIQEKENNFITSITDFADGTIGFIRTDLSTGENEVTLLNDDVQEIIQELTSSRSKELVVDPQFAEEKLAQIKQAIHVTVSYEENADIISDYVTLTEPLEQKKLQTTFWRMCQYLVRTQKRALNHLQPVVYYPANSYLKIDRHSKRNLELTETLRDKKKQGSLIGVIDQTVTAMGGRMLKKWVEQPLIQQEVIEERLNIVENFSSFYFEREELRDELKEVYDLERLVGRIAYGNVNARELLQLKRSLEKLPAVKSILEKMSKNYSERWFSQSTSYEPLIALLDKSLVEDPPISVKEGGLIKAGFHEELDTYRDASVNGKRWIAELEQKERQLTGIKTLKVGYNKVFGYFIEVTRANVQLLPEGRYERKQTLTNAERYITPELKEKEAIILGAEEKMEQLEYELFLTIRDEAKKYVVSIQELAKSISEIDVLIGFATVAENNRYTKPHFSTENKVNIVGGRHPVVESVIPKGDYVANDVQMQAEREMLLITGPNMAGKSTYMRQLALIVVMAQIGSYVPAEAVELPIFDQIFTRIGAADDLASGQSTFMVEMLETQYALTKASQNSLILLDEIGRGTSTYDGIALAQSIIEYIHDEVKAKTLFSTHYHELTSLEESLDHLKNVHVSATEEDGHVVFLHKVIDGQADRSYGIYVAELAKMPTAVTSRAEELLFQLEQGMKQMPVAASTPFVETVKEEVAVAKEEPTQLSLFPEPAVEIKKEESLTKAEKQLMKKIKEVDVLHLTPFEAMQKVYEWQKSLK